MNSLPRAGQPEMERNRAGFISLLFHADECLGEMLVVPQEESTDPSYIQHIFGAEIRVSYVSPSSERGLSPLAVLHTISPAGGPCFKMGPTDEQLRADCRRLDLLYSSCLEESKTSVVLLENGNELHLVAMESRAGGLRRSCFWAFLTTEGTYASCLGMLNLRCLAMVFDLDETLIVANTMRSFENRIEVLDRRVCGLTEMDPIRRSSMLAELKRYQEDRILLKQFVDNDQIFDDNGNIIEAQGEVVPPLTDGALPLVRPIIRLPDRNMVLTRINPSVRDTSVLVRLRPAWEELRGYLIAKGRKRFEVFICTMAEREYALEMWRLLDPDSGLINSRELMERVVCVKSGNKKSLLNVFPHHQCHPNMAMVVDDRLKVWEESDQPRVHVVPAFAPYSSPQAETNSGLTVPALRVARNVACNVRAGFFKHFDETLSQQVAEVQFETDIVSLPSAPDVSNCLVAAEVRNNVGHLQSFRGETEDMRLATVVNSSTPQTVQQQQQPSLPTALSHLLAGNLLSHNPMNSDESRESRQDALAESYSKLGGAAGAGGDILLQHHQPPPPLLRPPVANVVIQQHSNSTQSSSPVREEEGEVPESELDPDTRRRLLILQHGMDTGPNHGRGAELSKFDDLTPSYPGAKLPNANPISSYPGAEEEMSPGRPTRSSGEQLALKPESPSYDSQHDLQGPPGFADAPFLNHDRGGNGAGGGGPLDPRRRLGPPQDPGRFLSDDLQQQQQRLDGFGLDQQHSYMSTEEEEQQALTSRNLAVGLQQDLQLVHPGRHQQGPQTNFVDVLQGIAQKLKATVEYKAVLASSSARLLFKVEVSFAGQKVGEGTGSTKKEARFKAAEAALWFLARQLSPNPNHNNYPSLPQQQQNSIVVLGGNNPNSFLGGGVDDDDPMLGGGQQGSSRDLSGRLHPSGLGSGGGGGLDMDYLELASTSGQINFVATLKERCTVLGVNVNFQEADLAPAGEAARRFFHCQVEVGGQVLGKGSGVSWDIAKQHAAEEALRHLKRPGGFKSSDSPRSPPAAKRVRIGLQGSAPLRGRRGRGRGRSPPRRRPPPR